MRGPLDSGFTMEMTALARRSSGSGLSEQEGNGGGHRGQVGDATRLHHASRRCNPFRSRSLMGRPSGRNASPRSRKPEGSEEWSWSSGQHALASPVPLQGKGSPLHCSEPSGQSGHRNALSPSQRVSPGERAGSRSCIAHASRSQRHPANAGQAERQAGYQTKQDQGLIAGRAVGPARGMPKGMGEVWAVLARWGNREG